MSTADFLFEIHCEELPPKALHDLSLSLETSVTLQLAQQQLSYNAIKRFASPRRLALLISGLQTQQADQVIQKRGPAVSQAYQENGEPSKACLGFLKSCNANVNDLKTLKTDQGEWVTYEQHVSGKETRTLIADIFTQAIKELPVPKWMRWGNHPDKFARPVHSIILMCNDTVIDANILGHKTGNVTQGHRFLCNAPITITQAKDYEKTLKETGFVVADFQERKTEIYRQLMDIAQKEAFQLFITDEEAFDDPLLNEVTALVEWPTARLATFDTRFLKVPSEALISAMQEHQKCFPLQDAQGKLTNHFIFVSNIQPTDWRITTQGNEKVMTARLSDAKFFYDTDLKTSLTHRIEQLKTVTFQKQLGSLHDKALRLEKLCVLISNHHPQASRVGLLAKTDLLTNMVSEFTELQGIMGYHYALHDGELEEVATALREQYLPRFANDKVATSPLGIALSIADKLDNLVGSFGINQIPTGNKDPFALRRAAIGIIRTILENKRNVSLKTLTQFSIQTYQTALANKNLETDLLDFFNDRFRAWLKEQGFALDVIDAVLSLNPDDFYDAYQRMEAVKSFKALDEAESLAAANKRVANILQKNTEPLQQEIKLSLLEKPAEQSLYKAILAQEKKAAQSYTVTLKELAALRPLIDSFFDEVMVNAEDKHIRVNRLSLLARLRALFLNVGDIAYLQK